MGSVEEFAKKYVKFLFAGTRCFEMDDVYENEEEAFVDVIEIFETDLDLIVEFLESEIEVDSEAVELLDMLMDLIKKENDMKTERTIEMKPVEVTVYIADDGKKFNNIDECLKYEKDKYQLAQKLERLKKMKYFTETELGFDNLPVTEKTLNEDIWYATWIVIKSEEDISFIEESFKDISYISDLKIGEIVCLETEYTDDCIFDGCCYTYPLETMVTEIKNYLLKFGSDGKRILESI